MSTLLEIKKIDQAFRSGFWMKKVQILFGVDFKVPAGKIFGLLGANGAGKTTLIHLIVGLRTPAQGQVLIGDLSSLDRRSRSRIGYLPERPYFHEHLTGEGLLRYAGTLCGLSGANLRNSITEALKVVGMAHARELELKKYSKGMLQRIGIAQAFLHNPELLVLDEPMSGLDPVGRREIRELIVHLNKIGTTILFSSHILSDVEMICQEVAILKKGHLVGVGPIESFLKPEHRKVEIVLEHKVGQVEKILVPDHEDLNLVLKRAMDQGAKVKAVQPARLSLEKLL